MDVHAPGAQTPLVARALELLSVVVPIYNEAETVRELHRRVSEALAELPFELVLVDDGSRDGSAAVLDELAASDPRLRVIHLSRNFGHQAALTAGLDAATGNVVAMMDADLQDPPEVILTMLERWRAGADVVYAVREQREGETWFKLQTAHWFYRLFSRLAGIKLEHAGDFRLLDRRALDALLRMRERNRFLRGMTVWIGFTQAAVPYKRDSRYAGKTKFTVSKMLRFSLDAISSFSHAPLQLATLLGFAISVLAFFVGIPVVVVARITHQFVPGISSTLVVVLLLGGIQLITVGIIGEYVARIYDEVKGRPLYLVRERRGFE